MSEGKTRWWRDVLVIPLIVGLLIVLATFVLPKLFAEDRELSYTVDTPTKYLDEEAIGDLRVDVDGMPVRSLYGYETRVWNSGDLPLENVPIRFMFETQDTQFRIFRCWHNTTPQYEFGAISEEGSNSSSRRFVYKLLNEGDEDIVSFLCNQEVALSVHTKAPGLNVRVVEARKWDPWAPVIFGMIAATTALVTRGILEERRILQAMLGRAFRTK